MAEPLSDQEVHQRLAGSAWQRDGQQIVREVKLADFAAAMELVNEVARVAEEENHHPDICLHGWNRVRLALSTHSAGGLTAADFRLAERFDQLL